MWAIERPAGNGTGAVLRVGARRLALSDIQSVAREEETERDIKGLLVIGAAFIFASTIFIAGVVDIGWRTRFLIGAGLLFALAIVSLTETLSIPAVRYVRLRITTATGEVVFTTPDPGDALALERRIAAELGARS